MTRQDLKSVRAMKQQENSILRRIAVLYERVTNTAQELHDVSSGHAARDKHAEYVASVDGLETELKKAVLETERNIQRIDYEVNNLPNQQANIIRLRYYDGLSWNEVAKISHYSTSHAKKIHAMAVKNLCDFER